MLGSGSREGTDAAVWPLHGIWRQRRRVTRPGGASHRHGPHGFVVTGSGSFLLPVGREVAGSLWHPREGDVGMSLLDRMVERLLGRQVEALVRRALAERNCTGDLYRYQVHGDPSRLHLDPTAIVNNALFNLSSGDVTVESYAFFGHNVAVLTGTHDIQKFGRERQTAIPKTGRDVIIHEGAWVASEVVVVGPCEIGAHAVVAAGSLVSGYVPAYGIAVGRPAKVVRSIEHGSDSG
jgi:acetyltransferase-like isoleucine patch superfamily enzyme